MMAAKKEDVPLCCLQYGQTYSTVDTDYILVSKEKLYTRIAEDYLNNCDTETYGS